ncbi:MAG: hypothetical protein HRU72_05125 [Planctomycetia bacterium]|nr:MAG: hypothetical protein HRU72_05125 [Planctomycetia bacterium]
MGGAKGVEPVLVETFVEKGRFWAPVIRRQIFSMQNDTGTRQTGRGNEYALPVKDIYLYPLYSDASKHLCEGQTKGLQKGVRF